MVHFYGKIMLIALILCGSGGLSFGEDKPLKVFVSILPQKYFVQQIGGRLVDVQAMVQPGASPHTYEPKPGQMRDLSAAALYFAIGVPFEDTWLNRFQAANPKMVVVHTEQDIEKIPMASHEHGLEEGDHPAENGHDHDDAELDPHIWLSPPLVKLQASRIRAALEQRDPSHTALYKANYDQFLSRIDELDERLKRVFAAEKGLAFMVFHPSWGYFAAHYGLEQIPVEIEGKSPKPAQLQALIREARQKGIKVIFAQPQFSVKSADLIARAIGGQVVFADPLAEDWMANLRQAADKFEAALR